MERRQIDTYIITSLFIVSFVVLYKLTTLQYLYPFDGGERISAGQLSSLVNDVRRKSFDQVSWVDASDEETIYNNDKIFTDNNSKAQIKFESGNLITINEESLFKVSIVNNTINLDMERGSFIADLSSDAEVLLFILGGKEYKVKSKKGKIKITGNQISLLSGEASLESGSSKLQLVKGQVANLESKIEAVPVFPENLSVVDGKTYYIQKDRGLPLRWTSTEALALEISSNLEFKDSHKVNIEKNQSAVIMKEVVNYLRFINKAKDITSNITSVNIIFEIAPLINLNKSTFFSVEEISFLDEPSTSLSYEVMIDKRDIINLSTSRKFLLDSIGKHSLKFRLKESERPDALWSKEQSVIVKELPNRGPRIISPSMNQEFYLYGDQGRVDVKVAGDDNISAGLRFEDKDILFKENQMTSLLITSSGTKTVESFYSITSHIVKGDERKFHVYLEPSSLDLQQGSKFILKKPGQEVSFDWDGDNTGNYLVEISSERNFNRITKKTNVKGLSAKMRFSKTGELYWRAKKINTDGSVEYGAPKKIILSKPVAPVAPKVKKVIQKRVSESLIFKFLNFIIPQAFAAEDIIEWAPVNDVESYKIEIYKKDKLVLSEVVSENAISIAELTPGNYQYRIASIDYWEQQGEFSDFAPLIIEKIRRNYDIDLITPKHREVFQDDEEITFEWSTDEPLQNYKLEISNSLAFKIVKEFELKDNRFEINSGKITLKKVYWRVTSGKWKSKRRFFVVEKKSQPVVRKESKSWLVYFSPRKTSRETTATKIDGVDIISFGASYQFEFKDFDFFATFDKSSGKVFTDLGYTENTLGLEGLYPYGSFQAGLKLGVRNGNNFKVSEAKVIEERATNISFGPSGRYKALSLSYMAIGLKGLTVKYDFPISWYKRDFLFSPEFLSRDSDNYGKESSFGLVVGIKL